jgi:hypothetical protein
MALYETKKKPSANATFSFYANNKHFIHTLWVEQLEQPHQVTGSRHQSLHVNHWYPKSYAPGNLTITVRCSSQRDYQHLANFIRRHHRLMLETPGLRFSGKANSTGLRHLLLFRMPSENLTLRGWVPTFTLTKRGVFDPAPQYPIGFFVAIDPLSSNPIISHQIREYWNPAKMKPVDLAAIDPDQSKPNRNDPNDPLGEPGNKAGNFGGVGGR